MLAKVRYPGIANLNAQMAWSFVTTVDAGSRIVVTAPEGFFLTCSTEGALKVITLPGGNQQCEGEEGNTLSIILNETLTRNEFAFAIKAQIPPETPELNEFSIQILDRKLMVIDGAYGVPGVPIGNHRILLPFLSWTKSDPNSNSEITAGISFDEEVEWVRAILFTFPDTIIHDVIKPSQCKNLNRKFPLPSDGEFADTSNYAFIKVYTADTDSGLIPPDIYKWNFPVMLPAEMPRDNVWYISLCDDRSCRFPTDPSVVVHFPIAGFRMGERSPQELDTVGSFALQTALLSLALHFS
jgi:hypothetical protein